MGVEGVSVGILWLIWTSLYASIILDFFIKLHININLHRGKSYVIKFGSYESQK
ncbi:MAG: hypothetical protein PWQ70_586 [Clostridiales bacterium]|jgi:hypothetical protein|nr:hypothetical protein [Clostridiales bacterium]